MPSRVVAPRALRRNRATFEALAATLATHIAQESPAHTRPAIPARRDAHPKHHGCVDATFTVHDRIPKELRRGVFSTPREYRALVRFSNALKVQHDLKPDARGLAIKLLHVHGHRVRINSLSTWSELPMPEGVDTQDFLLVTHSEFFAANAAEFMDVPAAIIGSKSVISLVSKILKCYIGINPPRFRWRSLKALVMTMRITSNPLFLKYFSQVPCRLGRTHDAATESWQSAKFCVRPRQRPSWSERLAFWFTMVPWVPLALTGRLRRHENFLRSALNRYLTARGAEFTFYVQLRTDPKRMPLDDATRPWSERLSPYVAVATLTIHREPRYADASFADDRMAVGEHLTFSPWHALEDHRPLGSINRARRFVYARVSQMRHCLNGTDARVPGEQLSGNAFEAEASPVEAAPTGPGAPSPGPFADV